MQLIQTVHVSLTEDKTPIRTTEVRFSFTDEVQRGSALLDRLVPGWYQDLDLDKLNLASGYACVLGQLSMSRFQTQLREKYEEEYGDELPEDYLFDYSWVTRLLSETEDQQWGYDNDLPAQHGFYVNSHELYLLGQVAGEEEEALSRKAWEDLTFEWAHTINLRFLAERKAAHAVVQAAEQVVSTPSLAVVTG